MHVTVCGSMCSVSRCMHMYKVSKVSPRGGGGGGKRDGGHGISYI